MKQNFFRIMRIVTAIVFVCSLVIATPVLAAGNISNTQKFSQFLDADINSDSIKDYINWNPARGGATVSDDKITGFIWGETVGWINLGPFQHNDSGVQNTCDGELSGYAWGENTGWINFAPQRSTGVNRPRIDTGTGQIIGIVWSENYGWIKLSSPQAPSAYPSYDPTDGLITEWDGCSSVVVGGDNSYQCSDKQDNDGDGLQDILDPACHSDGDSTNPLSYTPNHNSELNNPQWPIIAQCNDGADNDGDGLIDPMDPGCHTDGNPNNPNSYVPLDTDESNNTPPQPPVTPGTPGTPTNPGNPEIPGNPINPIPGNPVWPPVQTVPGVVTGIMSTSFQESIDTILPILAIIGLLSSLPGLVARLVNVILTFFFYRKKQRGIVYDSKTKQPLDPAYVSVVDLVTGKEVVSQITDMDGRYGFILPQGRYKMTVGKTNYKFPSEYLAGKTRDEVYENLYFGDEFVVGDKEKVVVMNVPMDPVARDWNQQEKQRMSPLKYFLLNQGMWMWISNVLFAIGFVASILITWFYPVIWNIVMTALYVIVLMLEAYGLGPVTIGRITKNEQPVKNAIVRVINVTLGREVAHKVTTEHGGYYLLVPKADYYITVEEPQPDGTYVKIFTSGTVRASQGIINKSFNIQ